MIKRMDKEILAKYHQGRLIVRKYHQGRLYYVLSWLKTATQQAIFGAFGDDGKAVINATNAYLNGIAASDRDKATALAWFINEDPMMVCSLGLEPQGVTMPIRVAYTSGDCIFKTTLKPASGITYGAKLIATAYNQPEMSIFGSRTSNDTNTFLLQIMSQQWRTQSFGGWTLYGSASLNTIYVAEFSYKGIWVNGSKIASGNYTPTSAMSDIWLGVNNSGGSPHGAYFIGGYDQFYRKDENGNITNLLLPIKRNNTMELVDVYTGTLATRTGTWQEKFYLPDGTPWTPSTP